MKPCIFCAIVRGEVSSHQVWEDSTHLAFLDTHPSHTAMTLVIPKEHVSSDVFQASNKMAAALFLAAKEVASRISEALPRTERVALVFEGLEVDHLHAKLYPLNQQEHSQGLSTVDGPLAENRELEALAKKIRQGCDA